MIVTGRLTVSRIRKSSWLDRCGWSGRELWISRVLVTSSLLIEAVTAGFGTCNPQRTRGSRVLLLWECMTQLPIRSRSRGGRRHVTPIFLSGLLLVDDLSTLKGIFVDARGRSWIRIAFDINSSGFVEIINLAQKFRGDLAAHLLVILWITKFGVLLIFVVFILFLFSIIILGSIAVLVRLITILVICRRRARCYCCINALSVSSILILVVKFHMLLLKRAPSLSRILCLRRYMLLLTARWSQIGLVYFGHCSELPPARSARSIHLRASGAATQLGKAFHIERHDVMISFLDKTSQGVKTVEWC